MIYYDFSFSIRIFEFSDPIVFFHPTKSQISVCWLFGLEYVKKHISKVDWRSLENIFHLLDWWHRACSEHLRQFYRLAGHSLDGFRPSFKSLRFKSMTSKTILTIQHVWKITAVAQGDCNCQESKRGWKYPVMHINFFSQDIYFQSTFCAFFVWWPRLHVFW